MVMQCIRPQGMHRSATVNYSTARMMLSRPKAAIPIPSFLKNPHTPLFQPFHTLHDGKQRTPSKLRKKPIPFVTQVKEVKDPEEAFSLFQRYETLGFKHHYPSYSALIYKLARSGNFEAVETVLDRIEERNIHCQESLFIALIQHYGKAHLPEKAVQLFHKIPQFHCNRTLQSFNALLSVLVDNDRLIPEANGIFIRSYEMGFRPNSVSFNIMIKGWLGRDEWGKAFEVFDEMLERKVQPSVVTYNSLIGFLCKKGDLGKAMDLLEDMTRKRKYPNDVTYALLMEGLCSVGKYAEAKKMMFDMAYRGCKPRLINFGVLMNDLGKRGMIEEAKSLLQEMKKRRFKPDVVIYNILINYLCKGSKLTEAYKILTEMQVAGCKPNAATYRTMVDGFCNAGDFEGGLKAFNAMLISTHCPRLETFNCLVAGLLNSGMTDGACFVLEEMGKRKMEFDLEGWETLVKYACDEYNDATKLVSELTCIHELH